MAESVKKLSLGTVLDERYEIVKRIGSSYCGAVYQAKDKLNYDNLVALRCLDESSLSCQGLSRQIAFILDNGEKILEADHFNIAPIYDYELFGDHRYIVNECLLGYSLEDLIEDDEKNTLDIKIKYKLFRDICNSVAYLQEQIGEHYRLTPSNIFLVKKGKEYTAKIVGHEFCLLSDDDVIGERSASQQIYYPDSGVENHVIYALGRMLYEMVTGDQTDGINETGIPTNEKATDISILDIIMKCLESENYTKYNSINDIVRDIDSVFPGVFDVSSKKSDSNTNICPQCFFSNPPKAKHCVQCHSNLVISCPECANQYPLIEEDCSRCKTNAPTFFSFIAAIQRIKKSFLKKDPDGVYEAHKILPEEVNFLGDKGKKLMSSASTLKYITDENVSKAYQLKETVNLFLGIEDYTNAMECVTAYRTFVLTDDFINKQATELGVKIEEQAFLEASEKAGPFIEKSDFMSAVGVYQEYLREHPFGAYSHKANKIIKEELLEQHNALELLSLYSEIRDLIDDRKFSEAHNKGDRLFKVIAKLNDKDAYLDHKKVTANDLRVKTIKMLKELHDLEVNEQKKHRWLLMVGLILFCLLFCAGIGFFAFIKVQSRNAYEAYMHEGQNNITTEEFDSAEKSYQAARSVVGYSTDVAAGNGVRYASAMVVYTSVMRNTRLQLEVIRSKVQADEEYLVSKYFTLAINDLDTLNSSTIRPYLQEVEIATISNIRNNLFKIKRDYWRDRIERRPWVLPSIGIEFSMIQEASGVIGSPKSEVGRAENELLTNATLTSTIWAGSYEVSQQQYYKVMKSKPSSFTSLRMDRPVEMISWNDATEFCRKITEHERNIAQLTNDLEYRLPTIKEWELLCRAGSSTKYNTGESITFKQARFSNNDALPSVSVALDQRGTARIGSYKPNAWGLYDMHGNVAEWCSNSYKTGSADSIDQSIKCIKGGGWFDVINELRSAYIDSSNSINKFDYVGFRIVLAKK